MKYSIKKLIEHFESGNSIEFLYFWGHTKSETLVKKQCLSQWYESSFEFEEVTYKTAEHWMMAQKALLFNDHKSFKKIIDSPSPKHVKSIGREIKNFGPDIWNDNKYHIVYYGNLHKFTQNTALFNFLKSTQDKYLIDASPSDEIWGIGLSEHSEHIDNPYLWKGENLLGFALMEVRDEINKLDYFRPLKNAEPPPWEVYPEIESYDLFWSMGKGEDYVGNFFAWWETLSETDKKIYRITNPFKNGWKF